MLLGLLLLLRAKTKLAMVRKSEITFDHTYRCENSYGETSMIVASAGWPPSHNLGSRGLDVTGKLTVGTRRRDPRPPPDQVAAHCGS